MTTQPKPTAPDYPLIRPDQLSDAARVLYSQLGRPGSRREAHNCAADYPALVTELIDAGLATTGWKGELESVKVSAHYTRSTGDGSVLAVIRETNLDFPHKGTLLAVIEGATTMLRRDRAVTELTLRAHRDGVTDFEHSASRLFSADVVLPQLLEARDAETMWAGTLTELNAYAAGVDPLAQDDGDTHPGTCDSCATDHPFAPYLPPRTSTGPVMVTVEVSPLNPTPDREAPPPVRPYLPYIAARLRALLGSVLGLLGETPTLMGTSGGLLLATSCFYLADVHRRTGAGSDRKNL